VRETLALATPSGFEELPDPDTYLLKTRQDSEKLTEKLPSIVHIMPIIPNIIAENMNVHWYDGHGLESGMRALRWHCLSETLA
jgi:hypothetical protein